MLVDERAWGNDASHFTGVLRSTFGIRCCIVEEFLANGDVFVQVLDQYFEIPVELICRKARLDGHQFDVVPPILDARTMDTAGFLLPLTAFLFVFRRFRRGANSSACSK